MDARTRHGKQLPRESTTRTMSIGQLLSISVNVRGSTGELKWEKPFLNLRLPKFILIATSLSMSKLFDRHAAPVESFL